MVRLPLCAVLAASLWTVALVAQAPADAKRPTAESIVADKERAVVHVYVRVEKEKDQFGNDWFKDEDDKRTGAVIDPSGLVLTHWEVCAAAFEANGSPKANHSIRVELLGGSTFLAEVVAKDPGADLALIRFEPPAGDLLPWFELADSKAFLPGDEVVVIGSPDGKNRYVFSGVAAHAIAGAELGSKRLGVREMKPDELIVTDASIRPTDDAGPLVDFDGRLLGLCNAEHFAMPKADPTPEDMARPNFGVAVAAHVIRESFREEFADQGLENKTLRVAPSDRKSPPSEATRVLEERVKQAIVCVFAGKEPPELGLTDPYARDRRPGVGSGVVIDDSGLILTNLHIVYEDKESVHVRTLDGRTFDAVVLEHSAALNMALIQVKSMTAKLVYAPLGSSKRCLKGERVLTVGNPRGHTLSVSSGVLSAKNRRRRLGGRIPIGEANQFQIDAPIHSGNTGGAVLDANGLVIAIINAGEISQIAAKGEEKPKTNIGFAAPIDVIRAEFRADLDQRAGSNETVVVAADESVDGLLRRRSKITALAEDKAACMINVFVAQKIEKADSFDPFADDEEEFLERGLGSGVIIDAAGLALTNWHVIDGADNVRVRTGTGEEYAAEVLSSSRVDDLALLQLSLPDGAAVSAIVMGDSDALRIGAGVVAIGNPLGHANTVTAGVLSAKDQGIHIKGRARKFEGLIQTDAAINPGNSGGALLDLEGRLVGINSAGSNADAEVGYAIPVNYVVEKFHSRLLSAEKLNRAYLGLVVVDGDGGEPVVRSIDRFGPAARAGFQVGDVVRTVGAVAVSNRIDFVRLALAARAGEPLPIGLERDGKAMELEPAPISNLVWTVFRQTGIEVEEIGFSAEPELIRAAQVAMFRHYSRDSTGEPDRILPSAVRVVRVHPAEREKGLEVEVDDLIMGVELVQRSINGDSQQFVNFAQLARLGTTFRELATKQGAAQRCFVYRGEQIHELDVTIRLAR